jgi:hypothetical protein
MERGKNKSGGKNKSATSVASQPPRAPNNAGKQGKRKFDPGFAPKAKRSGNSNWAKRKKQTKKRRLEDSSFASPTKGSAVADEKSIQGCGNRTTASTRIGFYTSRPKSTSRTEINTGWSSCATLEVTCTNDMVVVDQWLTEHVFTTSEASVVGFDIEWRPAARFSNDVNPSALMQLAVADAVLLVHIKHIDNTRLLASKLLQQVSSSSVVKVGCAILDDAFKLFEDTDVSIRGRVDLAALAERGGLAGRGLSKLAKEVMNLDLVRRH